MLNSTVSCRDSVSAILEASHNLYLSQEASATNEGQTPALQGTTEKRLGHFGASSQGNVPIIHDDLLKSVACMDNGSESERELAVREWLRIVKSGQWISYRDQLIYHIRCKFYPHIIEASEEIRLLLVEVLTQMSDCRGANANSQSTLYLAECVTQGLRDEYKLVRIASCALLERITPSLATTLSNESVSTLCTSLVACCKSNHWRLRVAALNSLESLAIYYPELVWAPLSPIMTSLVVDTSCDVRSSVCGFFKSNPSLSDMLYPIMLCFDESPKVIQLALSIFDLCDDLLITDTSSRVIRIANALSTTCQFPHGLMETIIKCCGVENPSGVNPSLRLIPVLAVFFKDDSLQLEKLFDIMMIHARTDCVLLACQAIGFEKWGPLIHKKLCLSNILSNETVVSLCELLLQSLASSSPSTVQTEDVLACIDVVIVPERLTEHVAAKIVKICELLRKNRSSEIVDSILFRCLNFCPCHHLIPDSSYSRELTRLTADGHSIDAVDRKTLIHIVSRIGNPEQLVDEKNFCRLLKELLTNADPIVQIDGLEILFRISQLTHLCFPDLISSLLDMLRAKRLVGQGNAQIRKLVLFVLNEIVKGKRSLVKELMMSHFDLLTDLLTDSWSPDTRFLSLCIICESLAGGTNEPMVSESVLACIISLLEDQHEEIQKMAMKCLSVLPLDRLRTSEHFPQLMESLRIRAPVSEMAQELLTRL